jgi:arginyl-tRNA synthetase
MELASIISKGVVSAIKELYKADFDWREVQIQKTRPEFEGDVTVVVFPFLRLSRKSPDVTANEIGLYLKENIPVVDNFTAIKGFLNLVISETYYIDFLKNDASQANYGLTTQDANSKTYMVEYSSPNTNKPLHLGHIRNNLLGWSVCEILKATGKRVIKTNIVNDRGIHICKSMLAWQKWGNDDTPINNRTGNPIKGDHLVGEYYVKFDQEYKKQIKGLIESGKTEDEASKSAPPRKCCENGKQKIRKFFTCGQ